MNVVCVVIDGLHAGYLGPYGNSWIETPNFDRLAAESVVFENAFVDGLAIESVCQSLWSGTHAADRSSTTGETGTVIGHLRDAGLASTLMTDSSSVSAIAGIAGFDDVIQIPVCEPSVPAGSIGDTCIAPLFAAAAEWVSSADAPFLFWVHSRGMTAPWDGPVELRNAFVDDEEDDPPPSVERVERRLGEDYDPDEVLAYRRIYAGQIRVLDACIGALVESIEHFSVEDDTLILLMGARGYSLGEHRLIGLREDDFYTESVQIPVILKLPRGRGTARRSAALVQISDVAATIADWCGRPLVMSNRRKSLLGAVEPTGLSTRDRVVIGSRADCYGIRTPAWYLTGTGDEASGEAAGKYRLFVKPDDRWDQNDIADRCRDIVAGLRAAQSEWRDAGERSQLARLASELRSPAAR